MGPFKRKSVALADEVREEQEDSDNGDNNEDEDEDELSMISTTYSGHRAKVMGKNHNKLRQAAIRSKPPKSGSLQVLIGGAPRPWEYKAVSRNKTVETVLNEIKTSEDTIGYEVEFEDGRQEEVSQHALF
jgi:hypothetical protein